MLARRRLWNQWDVNSRFLLWCGISRSTDGDTVPSHQRFPVNLVRPISASAAKRCESELRSWAYRGSWRAELSAQIWGIKEIRIEPSQHFRLRLFPFDVDDDSAIVFILIGRSLCIGNWRYVTFMCPHDNVTAHTGSAIIGRANKSRGWWRQND